MDSVHTPFPACDVAMIPALLHSCEIKSGSGLGTRLTLVIDTTDIDTVYCY